MKFRIITLIITLGLPFVILSQSINIHEKNGTVHNYDMSEIDSITFTQGGSGMPCPGIETVEYEGKTYNTVQIGEQCWLKENLNIGTMIASNTDSDNQTDNGVIEKYCYGNDEVNCDTYGGLYQWDEAMTYSTTEGA